MHKNHNLGHPYSRGWPTWPFTRLSEDDMQRLLQKLEEQRWEELDKILLTDSLV